MLDDIENTQGIVYQRPILKPTDIYVSCYWEVGCVLGSFFSCSLIIGKKL